MKKILLSILAIALTVGTVSASAYALFSDTVNVAGITISSGDANLKLYDGAGTTREITSGANTGLKFEGLYPGFRDYGSFTFQNASLSPIKIALTGRLTNANGNWDELKNNIYVAVGEGTKENMTANYTGWVSLNSWNASVRSLNVPSLAKDEVKTYNLYVYIPADVGNGIAGKSLTNVAFEIYGTQE